MNLKQATVLMKQGLAFRRRTWHAHSYLYWGRLIEGHKPEVLSHHRPYYPASLNHSRINTYTPMGDDRTATDWLEYIEPPLEAGQARLFPAAWGD